MNIIKAAESVLKGQMDKYAFEINSCIHDQSTEGCIDRLLSAVSSYERSASQFEVLQKVKQQISTSPPQEDSEQNED
tara:strand:+ start:200 stop:430 length:231 start_codon:yes stop_codon:yes gene_type:complete